MSSIQPLNGELQVEELKDLNYVSANPQDIVEGTILSYDTIDPTTPGWIPADGSMVSTVNYPFLFNAIGYEYTTDEDRELDPDKFRLPSVPFSAIKYLPMDNPYVLENISALKNVIKMRLMSMPTDYRRNIGLGGILHTIIKKPMDDIHEEELRNNIADVMNSYGNLIAHQILIEKNLLEKYWKVVIQYSDVLNKYTTTTRIRIEG